MERKLRFREVEGPAQSHTWQQSIKVQLKFVRFHVLNTATPCDSTVLSPMTVPLAQGGKPPHHGCAAGILDTPHCREGREPERLVLPSASCCSWPGVAWASRALPCTPSPASPSLLVPQALNALGSFDLVNLQQGICLKISFRPCTMIYIKMFKMWFKIVKCYNKQKDQH